MNTMETLDTVAKEILIDHGFPRTVGVAVLQTAQHNAELLVQLTPTVKLSADLGSILSMQAARTEGVVGMVHTALHSVYGQGRINSLNVAIKNLQAEVAMLQLQVSNCKRSMLAMAYGATGKFEPDVVEKLGGKDKEEESNGTD